MYAISTPALYLTSNIQSTRESYGPAFRKHAGLSFDSHLLRDHLHWIAVLVQNLLCLLLIHSALVYSQPRRHADPLGIYITISVT